MDYARCKLGLAVDCLAQPGLPRDRLAKAVAQHLACIRIKDLPIECRAEFAALLDQLCMGRILEPNTSVRQMLDTVNDAQVMSMTTSITRLYAAVVRYQRITASTGES